jgi:hypothetical protein
MFANRTEIKKFNNLLLKWQNVKDIFVAHERNGCLQNKTVRQAQTRFSRQTQTPPDPTVGAAITSFTFLSLISVHSAPQERSSNAIKCDGCGCRSRINRFTLGKLWLRSGTPKSVGKFEQKILDSSVSLYCLNQTSWGISEQFKYNVCLPLWRSVLHHKHIVTFLHTDEVSGMRLQW